MHLSYLFKKIKLLIFKYKMYSIHNREDLEKLKKLNQINNQLKEQRLKKKLGRQDFHFNVKELFEPVTKNQSKMQEKIEEQTNQIKKSKKQSISIENTKNITDAIDFNTLSAQESNKNLSKSIYQGIQNYDEISKQTNQTIIDLINQNQISYKIGNTLSTLLNNNNPQFKISENQDEETKDIYEFAINENLKVPIKIKGKKIIFKNGVEFDLTDPSLNHFLNKTKIDRHQIKDFRLIKNFLFHIGYNPKIGDTRSERYRFILDLYDKSYGNLIKSESKSESEIEEEEIILSASGLKE